MALMAIAQRIDGYLMKAWESVVELSSIRLGALEPEQDRIAHH